MAIEIGQTNPTCFRCGKQFLQRKGNFYISYTPMNKGVGYLPYCKSCVESMFNSYYATCGDMKLAVRQMCRKLDAYWNESIYNVIFKKNTGRSIMAAYLQRVNTGACIGRCFDNTLTDTNSLWSDVLQLSKASLDEESEEEKIDDKGEDIADEPSEGIVIPDEVINYWGNGYDPETYLALEKQKINWTNGYQGSENIEPDVEALIKQICFMEVDINKARAAGKSIDKLVPILNNLLSSLNSKTKRKRTDDTELENTPLGVWLYRYENERPLPEVSEDLKDVNGLKKYIFTWLGHICKMVGLKNGYTKMYEREIERLRVQRPEYDDEDDESLLMDVFGESSESDEDNID